MAFRKMIVTLLFSALAVYGWSYLGVPQEALIAMCLGIGLMLVTRLQELEERIDRLERHVLKERADM